MFKEDHLSFRQRKYMKVKNIIGRALGGIGLVVLSPVYLAIIVAIKKEDGITAPVFFSQKRVGIHKEYFNLYKFRSMRTDTPHDKPTHLLENPDQYITKVGRFLRKSSLDELPQLWNIARGDMAVIGPRPALWNQDDLIAERDKYGANDVKPGLTGWAQINGRDELEIPVKARLDGEYVKKMGPLMDIRCFIGTVFSVLRSDGVVEGGTGAKKKLMVITNHSYMLWQFRRELIGKLMEDYDVIISTPFVGHEDDFKAMGCTMIETDVDRRGINPKTDMKLYLTYRRLLKEHHPDMVVTYSIKPNVYAGYACRQMRIPYCVNVQGLGTAFQKKIQLDEAENTPEGEAVPGQMACRAGKSSFVVNWQGEMRSCVVLDKPSIPLRNVEFEEAWKFTKKETESLRISARCSSCKLRKVCNTCVAAAIAETGKADGVPEYLCRYTEATVRYLKETSKK